jgi:hypothetical protein
MSLSVPAALIGQAQEGEVGLDDFLQCIKDSLPYAWNLVEGLANRLEQSSEAFVDNQVPPPGEMERGQLLRMLASDAMRNALEQHYGIKLAFQNCHRVALFRKDTLDRVYQEFISPRSQILNQKPELVDC